MKDITLQKLIKLVGEGHIREFLGKEKLSKSGGTTSGLQ